MIRPATLEDLNVLVDIESRSFETDRISRRSLRSLPTHASEWTIVDSARRRCVLSHSDRGISPTLCPLDARPMTE